MIPLPALALKLQLSVVKLYAPPPTAVAGLGLAHPVLVPLLSGIRLRIIPFLDRLVVGLPAHRIFGGAY
jgi:hypothetical protein